MKKLFGNSLFEDIYNSSSRRFVGNKQIFDASLHKSMGSVVQESYDNFQPEYEMQRDIRKYFGNRGLIIIQLHLIQTLII